MSIYLYYALPIVAVIVGFVIFSFIRDYRAGSKAPRSSCSSSLDSPRSYGSSWLGCSSCSGGGCGGCSSCGGCGGE